MARSDRSRSSTSFEKDIFFNLVRAPYPWSCECTSLLPPSSLICLSALLNPPFCRLVFFTLLLGWIVIIADWTKLRKSCSVPLPVWNINVLLVWRVPYGSNPMLMQGSSKRKQRDRGAVQSRKGTKELQWGRRVERSRNEERKRRQRKANKARKHEKRKADDAKRREADHKAGGNKNSEA